MEEKRDVHYASHCSEKFNRVLFPYFAKQLKTAAAKEKYLYAIDSLCEYVGKDFLLVDGNEALSYYRKLLSGEIRRKDTRKEADLQTQPRPLSKKTVYMRFACVRSFATYLQANQELLGITYDSPFTFMQLEGVRPSELVKPSAVPLKSELDSLFSAITDRQMYLIVALVVKCGLPVKQLITLAPRNIVLDKKDQLAIRFTRGHAERVIKVPEELAVELLSFAENNARQEYLFSNSYGKPLTERTLQLRFKKLSEDAGLSGWTLQDLRNTAACYMLGSGFTKNEVAKHLGVQERWMYRYDRVVEELERQPSDYGLMIPPNKTRE